MWFTASYTLLGGMGMFFFGMKILSESLQALSGDLVRRIIGSLSNNRLMAVVVGIALTALLQSSTLCTVMVVGLVNAQLMALSQAIGVIFGANIGTTFTGWLISVKIGGYGLLFIGVGALPVLVAKKQAFKQIGHLIVSVGLVFIGLQYMMSAFKPLGQSPAFLQFLSHFSADSMSSLIACIGMGMITTMLIHSSAGTLAISMALASAGGIGFQTAVGFGLGAEIGTTVTAVMAGIGANTNAKRAGRAHALFNVAGVLLVIPVFYPYVALVDWLTPGDPNAFNADHMRPYVSTHIAAAQTLFNIVTTLLFLPFLKSLERFVVWMVPEPLIKEVPHLRYLPSRIDMEAPALALVSAEKELKNLASITGRAVDAIQQLISEKKFDPKLFEKILNYESISDAIQGEITLFLCRTQQARLSSDQAAEAYAYIQASDELESVADYCASLARSLQRLSQSGENFTEGAADNLYSYTAAVAKNFHDLVKAMHQSRALDLEHFEAERKHLALAGERLRELHRRRLEKGQCSPAAGMVFTDIIVGLKKLQGHTYEVAKALASRSFGA